MAIRWKGRGESMGTIDLRQIGGDEFVIHFGGEIKSVDAYTFANSLISISDTVRAINEAINPGQSLEIRVEALGPGSFRAQLKKRFSGVKSFFSDTARDLIIGLLGALIYDHFISDNDVNIIVKDDSYIIERGNDVIILPKAVYEHLPNVRVSPKVQKNLQKTFETLENDPAVENFGITPNLEDETPLVDIPKSDFARLSHAQTPLNDDDKRRTTNEVARLLVRKLWLEVSAKKWSFEWNGVPISAPIRDEEFLNSMVNRVVVIGAGDALDVVLEFEQDFDEDVSMWVNDHNSYRVIKVRRHLPKSKDQGLLSSERN